MFVDNKKINKYNKNKTNNLNTFHALWFNLR